MRNRIQNAYGVGGPIIPVFPVPIKAQRAPVNGTDIDFPQGQTWWDNSQNPPVEYVYNGNGTWSTADTPVGAVSSVTGTTNQIAAAPTSGAVILSLIGPYTPATYTAHGVLLGEGTGSIVAVAPSATVGQALVSTGATTDPAYGTVTVPGGGTGAATLTGIVTGNGTAAMTANAVTQHGVLIGGAANAASSLAVAATGTLLAGATGADPAFTASPSVTGSLTAGTTLTATLGAITATNGNLVLGTAGNKISITTGANASLGTTAAMGGTPGTVTVTSTAVTTSSIIIFSRNTTGGTPGNVSISAQTNGSFTLLSTGNETSTFNYLIIN